MSRRVCRESLSALLSGTCWRIGRCGGSGPPRCPARDLLETALLRLPPSARLAYVDTDPVFTQIGVWKDDFGLRRRVDGHDAHFSFGECLGADLPATGHCWQPTRQPVVLGEWRPSSPRREVFTTVMNWASYDPSTYQGRTYGQKDLEFARFVALPRRAAPAVFELGVRGTRKGSLPGAGEPREPGDLIRHLTQNGWRVVDATKTCPDFESYRAYIESSKAEWTVAKNGYVLGQAGWFSDRSACYLAAGRPVVVEDCGFGGTLPVGEGLLSFSTLEEAVEGVRRVEADHERHARAAREIAGEYFSSDRVLTRLVDRAMAADPEPVPGRIAGART